MAAVKKKTAKRKVPRHKTAKKKVAKKRAKQKTTPQKKTAKNPKGAGAQEIIIDWDKVDAMGVIQCTGEEIASVLGISYDTLERACKRDKKIKFADYIEQKKKGGKASLRRKQWKLAEKGNATMLIWLGKNMLNQKDKSEVSGPDGGPVESRVTLTKDLTKEELEKELAKYGIKS
jgi:hypothetical protein